MSASIQFHLLIYNLVPVSNDHEQNLTSYDAEKEFYTLCSSKFSVRFSTPQHERLIKK